MWQLRQRLPNTSQMSSRRPRKKGCRTFPSLDLARYSISARSCGSTQMPRWAILLVMQALDASIVQTIENPVEVIFEGWGSPFELAINQSHHDIVIALSPFTNVASFTAFKDENAFLVDTTGLADHPRH
jgi:hypothetical protein